MNAPINQAVLDHALRLVRRTFEQAERGDETAKRALIRFAASDVLETSLTRMAAFADRCAPSLDELRINVGHYSSDAAQLRYEVDKAADVLSQAAGRAVIVEHPAIAGGASPSPIIERDGADPSHDNGELPRAPVSYREV